jgi:acyl-CoA dehydrogenase
MQETKLRTAVDLQPETVLPGAESPLSLKERMTAVAKIAAQHAAAVDRDARFPIEAFDALREKRLLGVAIPVALGGDGASLIEIADACSILGRSCASTALMYAMHQINTACIVRHAKESGWLAHFQRRIAESQLLLASSTTEGAKGGDLRSSDAAIQRDGLRIALRRDASVISYGEYADAIVTTARVDDAADSSDQALVAFERKDYTLRRSQSGDTLGMRGTCSGGFILEAQGHQAQVLSDPYSVIHAQTMMPLANVLWSAVWTGIAAGAVQRARAFVRVAAGPGASKLPPGAAHLTRARASLEALQGMVHSAVSRVSVTSQDAKKSTMIEYQLALNLHKVEASELAVSIVLSAMRASGLAGYRNDGEFAMGRYLRDILSAPIMISNDRILANAQLSALLSEPPIGLVE